MCSHSKFDLSTRLLSYDTVIYRIPRYIEFYFATEFYCRIATVYGQSSYILPVGAKKDWLEGFLICSWNQWGKIQYLYLICQLGPALIWYCHKHCGSKNIVDHSVHHWFLYRTLRMNLDWGLCISVPLFLDLPDTSSFSITLRLLHYGGCRTTLGLNKTEGTYRTAMSWDSHFFPSQLMKELRIVPITPSESLILCFSVDPQSFFSIYHLPIFVLKI